MAEENIIDNEYEYAKKNLIDILQQSDTVLKKSAELATETEHPRMIEVYSNLIKSLADINKNILDLREKKTKILKDESPDKTTPSTTNAIFVGSTNDILKAVTSENI